MTADQSWLRDRFPVLAKKTYLNSGSYGALSIDVKEAFEAYLTDRLERGADWDWWVRKNESVRASMAAFLNADADEVAITASASAGINAIASALDFAGGRNKIIVSDFEFPTNAQIWHAQEKRGAQVVHVPVDADGYIPLSHFEQAIDARTKIVAVTHVCYRNGARLDIEGIARIAKANGALMLADCYQSIGAVPVDARELPVDFLVGGMLKYLLGTAGIGFLYVKRDLIAQLVPTVTGWFAQADISAMDITANRPSPTARRFEAGTPPVPNCYAAEAGIKILRDVGMNNIGRRIEALTQQCIGRLQDEGFSIATPLDMARRGPTVAIRSHEETKVVDALLQRDIVTSCRDGNIRASFHFYNNEDDIEQLARALNDLRPLMHSV